MFTGIVQEIGFVMESRFSGRNARIKLSTRTIARPVLGESIAVNGTCLTVQSSGADWFIADVMPQTWRDTNLSGLKIRDPVNLERALRVGDAMGGHMVSGHVDGVGTIRAITRAENAVLLKISAPLPLLRQMVIKGSVAVDGVSLTIQALDPEVFTVSLIPHTFGETRFSRLKSGGRVNIETDMLTKKSAVPDPILKKQGLTLEFLRENGFL